MSGGRIVRSGSLRWREDARADDDPAKRMGLGRTDDRLEFKPKTSLLDLVVAPSEAR